MVINATDIWNSTGFIGYVNNINTSSNELLMVGFLFAIFIIMLFIMKNYETKVAMFAASFMTMMVAVLLFATGLILSQWLLAILAGAAMISLWISLSEVS